MQSRKHGVARGARGCSAALLAATLAGCVANSSNPLVVIRSARSDDSQASFDLEVSNPGGRHLTLTRVDYDVSHGESSFPVGNGSWNGSLDLPAKGQAMLHIDTPFQGALLEPDSRLLHLHGELFFTDRTGFLGLKKMDLTSTSFQGEIEAEALAP